MRFPWHRDDISESSIHNLAKANPTEEAKKDIEKNAKALLWPEYAMKARFNSNCDRVTSVKVTNPSEATTTPMTARFVSGCHETFNLC